MGFARWRQDQRRRRRFNKFRLQRSKVDQVTMARLKQTRPGRPRGAAATVGRARSASRGPTLADAAGRKPKVVRRKRRMRPGELMCSFFLLECLAVVTLLYEDL